MKVYFESYGCTLNKAETSLYINSLIQNGDSIVEDPEDADLSIIGTCVVIKKTEEHMMRRISELSRITNVKVVGCMSPIKSEFLNGNRIETIDRDYFRNFYGGSIDTSIIDAEIVEGIPINQGCTGKCKFCISHIARGPLVSRKPEKIVNQIKMLLERNKREIRITSLDTAAYGRDIDIRLPDLMNMITSIDADFKLRVGMMEPKNTKEIADRLMEAYENPKVFKFLHIPVQSGDDSVLESMNREYRASDFLEIVGKFRKKFHESILSTDVIIGYYSEDSESFEKTYKIISMVEPDILNITRFSPREYTLDYDKKTMPSNKMKENDLMLRDLHSRIIEKHFSKMIGKEEKILITERGKNESYIGRDDAYRPVVVSGNLKMYGFYNAEITSFENTSLFGRIIY
ncbi:MAG: tRNA (N(6)-L-threonylcarbamoyladenosine(37)-C(2))-methylthiotransferase [Thermoplasmata archaeon]